MPNANDQPLATSRHGQPRVGIAGGGLAGLATAVALCQSGLKVELFEARSRLGGRAGSFRDPATGEFVDLCQHVSMGCCTNLADFCRRTGIADLFRRQRVLHFFGPGNRQCDFQASRWLPPPLHLAPAMWRLSYLNLREKVSIAQVLWKLARSQAGPATDDLEPTVADWLRRQGQSQRVFELFWSPVLVSALGESLEKASLSYARQVFVEGFLAASQAYEVFVPAVPLGELYGQRLESWLTSHCVELHLEARVAEVHGHASGGLEVVLADGARRLFDSVVVATPWQKCRQLLCPALQDQVAGLDCLDQIEASPITGVHLWFDRPIMALEHAVLVGRLSQWVFRRPPAANESTAEPQGHYYQVVISASHALAGRQRDDLVRQICDELRAVWPAAREANLLDCRVVTDPAAVFSAAPGIDRLRPPQQTAVAGLFLAGDWTATGWPSTMEGAVRSGYLAAEGVLAACGRPESILVPGLPRGWLAKRLFGPR